MNRNLLWKFLFIVFVVAWSAYSLIPLTSRPTLEVFKERALNRDAAYTNIVRLAEQKDKELPGRSYANLKEAAGTNELAKYFPQISVKGEKDPNTVILHRLQQDAAGKIKLGLDLRGGTSFLVEMDTTRLDTNKVSKTDGRETALANAVEVLRKRVDKLGVAEPIIQPAGADQILIQLPGLNEDDKESARRSIQKAAFLEFRMVHPNSRELISQGIVEPGYELLKEEHKMPDGSKELIPYLVKKKAELNGKYVKRAFVTRNPMTGQPEISFELNDEGAKIFAEVTRENVGQLLGIVLDGELESAPRINSEIPGGHGVIQGQFDVKEAYELANVLENPLEAPVVIKSENSVDPSLGADSIKSGIKAVVIGTAAVVAFMFVYYLTAGVVANIALMLNIVVLLAVMCAVGTTLTLPGIAGILLTIGMAVDANVLIFERIREELAAGKSLRGALNAGYSKAFGTIFDSNLTTLISSIILIFMGSGSVKGFGVALTIGIIVSMFTALVVTRLVFDFLLAKNWLKSLPMLHLIKGAKIDFIKWAVPAFVCSWLLIMIGNGYGLYRGRDVLGVEFSGGDRMSLGFAEKIGVDKIRESINKVGGVGDALIAYQRDLSTGKETLSITTRVVDTGKATDARTDTARKVYETLKQDFPKADYKMLNLEKAGPTVAAEIQRSAVIAALLAMFGILVYVAFRYEFSFAVGAVVAIIHDIFMTLGWFFLVGGQLNGTVIAAVLTIIGFSINDTIVIFDRIREDLKMGVRGTFREVINDALNKTLSRTIITSGTVFLATVSLYLFGGGVINDFAFTFLVGIITGTYSSIYIATALVLWWHKGQRPSMGSGAVLVNDMPTAPAKA